MKAWLITIWMIFLWCLIFLVPCATAYSNCWYWSVWQRITRGGQIKPVASKRWSGHHWIWIDPQGTAWEYTTRRRLPAFTPWYKLIVYQGHTRKFRSFNK